MSHELRTPLNVVMGYSSLLKLKTYGEINPKQAEILDKVLLNANHQLVMIDRILEVTQIAAGATLVLLQEVDLKGLIDEFRETFAVREKDGVVLKWNIAPLPMVETDGDKLKHILQNLIDNAIKFTEEGEIVVSASYDHPREELSLIVADTGTGIAAENIPHLFEMFSQCDSSETRLHGGAGIGLYIVKNLTERLRGRVEVASKPGRGSTFTVTIPAKRKMKRMTA
jgi:signal transduction histidine kinase